MCSSIPKESGFVAERVYAFEAYAARAADTVNGAGVAIAPRRLAAMFNVRGPGDAVSAELKARYALEVLPPVNTATGLGRRVLGLGPDEWLVIHDMAAAAVAEDLSYDRVSIVDVSQGRAALRLRGTHVRHALAKGCSFDLDARVFPPGRCAQTAIGRISVILDHVESDVFDVYCSRSYAGSFWHWMAQACAEYRYTIGPPE
jgi:sarcosine oxidase subunit gamma